ncbi:MAG: acetylglutamate kinase [Candidatus Omnitrophica bacterium]|nr:acetylglutamate kinase [Candidatus Omnitrophota bacterium]
MEENIKKADVLIEALPYLRNFKNKVIVVKYGGSSLEEEKARDGILQDLIFMNCVGMKPVLVHGGGPAISQKMREKGKKPEFVDGLRITDKETIAIVEEELERINEDIVKYIRGWDGNARGLSGKRDGIIRVKKVEASIDVGYVGEITSIFTGPVKEALNEGAIPVIAPLGLGANKQAYNVNADSAAAELAVALNAEKLVVITNVRGILRNREDPGSLISTLRNEDAKQLIESRVIDEGMIPKVKACVSALEGGVKKAHIVSALLPHALLLEIFTPEGIGTEFVKEENKDAAVC